MAHGTFFRIATRTFGAAIGAVLGLLLSHIAFAQSEAVTGTVSATVLNNFTLTEVSGLNFGTFVAIPDAVTSAVIAFTPSGGNPILSNNPPAKIIYVDSSSASLAVFAVSNAAPNTTLHVSYGGAYGTLVCAACSLTNPTLGLELELENNTVVTDGTGAATIEFGGFLGLDQTTTPYEDGTYISSFNVTVSY